MKISIVYFGGDYKNKENEKKIKPLLRLNLIIFYFKIIHLSKPAYTNKKSDFCGLKFFKNVKREK
jgi:hypothetical protein